MNKQAGASPGAGAALQAGRCLEHIRKSKGQKKLRIAHVAIDYTHTKLFKAIFGNRRVKKEGTSSFLGTGGITLMQNQEKTSTIILFLYFLSRRSFK